MSEQCLELKNVCKSFRDFTLNNISFTLPQGYIMGLVGPNGAGKTTTIQLILNMLEKDAGRILAFGKDNVVSEKEIKQDIGIVFDSIFYVDSWTVKDTEKAVSIFYDNWRHDIFNDMVKRFDLPLNKKVGELSRGMQMKLIFILRFNVFSALYSSIFWFWRICRNDPLVPNTLCSFDAAFCTQGLHSSCTNAPFFRDLFN